MRSLYPDSAEIDEESNYDFFDASHVLSQHDYIQIIYTFFPLFSISLGTLGNVISLVIFSHKKFTLTPLVFYHKAASIIEIAIFFTGCLKFFLQANFQNPLTSSLFWCKFLSYLIRPMLETASWIQFMITLNIYLMSINSKKYKFLGIPKFQFLIVILIFSMFLIYHTPVILFYGFYGLDPTLNGTTLFCFVQNHNDFVIYLNDIGLLFIFCIFPFIFILILTKSILASVINMKKKLNTISKEKRKVYIFAFSIIFQNIWFLVLTLPLSCTMPILSLYKMQLIQYTYESKALIELLIAIFNLLLYFYFATKCLVYFCFNSIYRQVFIEIFFKCTWKGKSYQR